MNTVNLFPASASHASCLPPTSHHPRMCPWKSSTYVRGAGERSEDSLLVVAKKRTSIFSQPLFRDFCLFVCFTHKTESFSISQYSALLVYFFIISHSVAMTMSFITEEKYCSQHSIRELHLVSGEPEALEARELRPQSADGDRPDAGPVRPGLLLEAALLLI